MRTIIVASYDPAWPAEFERIRAWLWPQISELALDIQHVGSTSVPGLAAKPIIDFNIVIESYDVFPRVKERLECLGYIHEGDLGVPTREAFKPTQPDDFMAYHMYICPKDSLELRRQMAFRDWLRCNDDDRDAYAALKRLNAKKHPHDIDAYIAGKSDLVEEVLRKCSSTPSV